MTLWLLSLGMFTPSLIQSTSTSIGWVSQLSRISIQAIACTDLEFPTTVQAGPTQAVNTTRPLTVPFAKVSFAERPRRQREKNMRTGV